MSIQAPQDLTTIARAENQAVSYGGGLRRWRDPFGVVQVL